jgi:hypothetical protein
MVAVDSWIRLEDFVSARDLAGVAGEARAAHLYAHPGHEEGLLRDCRRIPGAIALSRAEAVAAGLFGPDPSPPARERLGDVVVTFDAPGPGLVWAGGPGERRAPAQHGGLSEAELLVPLLRVGGSG